LVIKNNISSCTFQTKLFLFVQGMMDLPLEKEREMRKFNDEKKWEIICDQVSYWLKWSIVVDTQYSNRNNGNILTIS